MNQLRGACAVIPHDKIGLGLLRKAACASKASARDPAIGSRGRGSKHTAANPIVTNLLHKCALEGPLGWKLGGFA